MIWLVCGTVYLIGWTLSTILLTRSNKRSHKKRYSNLNPNDYTDYFWSAAFGSLFIWPLALIYYGFKPFTEIK